MTIKELLRDITSIRGVRVLFKTIDNEQMLIFWYGQSPIANVSAKAVDYNTNYPKLFEMELEEIIRINDSLYEYVNTSLDQRGLDTFI